MTTAKNRRKPNRVEPISGQLFAQLDEIIQGMTDAQLICRDLGHAWTGYTAHRSPDGVGFESVMRCQRKCGATKTRHISADGYLLGNKFTYKDPNYVMSGFGRPTQASRAGMRLQSIIRTIK